MNSRGRTTGTTAAGTSSSISSASGGGPKPNQPVPPARPVPTCLVTPGEALTIAEDYMRQVQELRTLQMVLNQGVTVQLARGQRNADAAGSSKSASLTGDSLLDSLEEDATELSSIVSEHISGMVDATAYADAVLRLETRSLIDLSVSALLTAPVFNKATQQIDEESPFHVVMKITLPRRYPSMKPVEWTLQAPDALLKAEYNEVLKVVADTVACFAGLEHVLAIVEAIKTTLLETRRDLAVELAQDAANDALARGGDDEQEWAARFLGNDDQLGRRMIYFHHILSTMKRQCITRWARVLRLNGFCKIGYPGLLLVEGPEESCAEYVRQLQRLRWKLMVVRGEETLPVPSGTSLDACRHITSHVGIVETVDSAEIGDQCKRCDLHDLFLTGMKIYK